MEFSKINTNQVNHPAHYNQSGIECIDAMEAAVEGLEPQEALLVGTAIKYLWRFKHKESRLRIYRKQYGTSIG